MVPYFPTTGERAAVERISPLAAEEPATLLLQILSLLQGKQWRLLQAEILDYK